MTPKELIAQTRLQEAYEFPKYLGDIFAFKPSEPLEETSQDLNINFRIEVVQELLNDFSIKDLPLIRQLYQQELECEKLIWRHDNIYQLSYYLFELGQLEDCFLIYRAKYQINHMDISLMMDREMLTLGHDIDDVLLYVKEKFKENPELEKNYQGLLEQLVDLRDKPIRDLKSYKEFIKGYYFGHKTVENIKVNKKSRQAYMDQVFPTIKTRKHWWKFRN